MVKKLIAVLIFVTFTICPFIAQTKKFSIKVAGIKIGTLYANHIKNGSFDYYVTSSIVEVFIFKKVKIYVTTEVLYKDTVLIKSTVKSNINGNSYSSKTVWKDNHYDIDCNTYNYNFKDTTLTTPIKWSTSKLYFERPAAGEQIYTESYGNLGAMIELKDKGLKMISPKSKQVYYYSGKTTLTKLEVISSIKNFEIYPADTLK